MLVYNACNNCPRIAEPCGDCVWNIRHIFNCQNYKCPANLYDKIQGDFRCAFEFDAVCHAATPPKEVLEE